MSSQPESIVRDFCAAVGQRDAQALAQFFTHDTVYHNMPLEAVIGVENIVSNLAGQISMGLCEFQILNIAVSGNIVLTERVDVMELANGKAPVPVMGTFEIVENCIVAWRDYFDVAQVAKLMTPPASS